MNEQVDAYWGLTDELNEAIKQVRESAKRLDGRDESGRSAAYLLLSWGRCRLFAVPVEEELLLKLFDSRAWSAGLSWLWVELRRLRKAVQDEAWLDEDPTLPFVRHAEPLDILKSRLYLQGVSLVLDDHGLHRQVDSGLPDYFRQRVGVFAQLLEDLDEAIGSHRDTLCVVAETAWPQNVVRTLPDDAWQPRPWWLTAEASELRQEVLQVIQRLNAGDQPAVHCLSPVEFCTPGTVTPGTVTAAHLYAVQNQAASVAEPSFSTAADIGRARDKVQIAEFSDGGTEEERVVQFHLPTDYAGRQLADLPSTVPIDVIVLVYRMREEAADDREEVWRLRAGSIVRDVRISRVPPIPAGSVMGEWRGTFQLLVRDLKSVVREDRWPHVHLRRLA